MCLNLCQMRLQRVCAVRSQAKVTVERCRVIEGYLGAVRGLLAVQMVLSFMMGSRIKFGSSSLCSTVLPAGPLQWL